MNKTQSTVIPDRGDKPEVASLNTNTMNFGIVDAKQEDIHRLCV